MSHPLLRDVYEGERVSGTPLERARFLCKTALRERGWTPRLIDALLGGPHETRPNPYGAEPHYEGFGLYPMLLWRKRDVLAAERDPLFVNRPRRQPRPLKTRP
jgi:hypothetical protein